MTKELDIPRKYRDRFNELESRLTYCENVAAHYKMMYEQLTSHLKILDDRQGNVQAVYDYMVKVGSQIQKHNPHGTAFLLPNDDPIRLKSHE